MSDFDPYLILDVGRAAAAGELSPREMITALMSRSAKPERY